MRPNRSKPRHWSMRSVAKVYCHALTRHGGTRAEFEKALLEVCDAAGKEKKTSAAAQALAVAEETIVNNEDILQDSYRMFQIVNGLLSLLLSLVPFARFGNLAARIVGRASSLPANVVEAQLQVIQIQRAANDAALRIVRQAAANEARFVRAANE